MSHWQMEHKTMLWIALHHLRIDYSDIEVVLVGMPHHPLIYPYLDDGQWDGYEG